jgi:hypothetical protein
MVLGRKKANHAATISRVSVKAVNTVVMMPMPSVSAKPRTAPDPTKNSTAAAIKVVVLESTIVANAFVDQHVGVHRHAHGEHDAGNPRQRQRRAEQRQDTHDHHDVDRHRGGRDDSENPVGRDHE